MIPTAYSFFSLPNATDSNYNYLAVDFYIRSKNNNISLHSNSYLKGLCEESVQGFLHTSVTNQSTYGDFSADALVGAMRVSFVGANVRNRSNNSGSNIASISSSGTNSTWDKTADCKLVWLPRPDVCLVPNEGSLSGWHLYTGITANTDANTFVHNYYALNNQNILQKKSMTSGSENNDYPFAVSSDFTSGDTMNNDAGGNYKVPKLGSNQLIGGDQHAEMVTINSKQYYVYKYTLNIWIEGTDAEARRAMDNGTFDLNLVFG